MTFLLPTLLAAVLAFAQASSDPVRPNFNGSWAIDLNRSASENPGEKLDIKQTGAEIVIETTRGGKPFVRTFAIEGTAQPGSSVSASDAFRAYWNGLKLVTEGSTAVQGQTVSTRETLSLNPNGTELTVERLVVVQHGYSFRGAQNYGIAKDVYVRRRPES